MTGIIIIDKPSGMTSFGAVARVRRICSTKKCGHTGTLDPMATGVLTVMLGGATRFCELLESHDKSYIASFRLGNTPLKAILTLAGEQIRTIGELHGRSISVTIEGKGMLLSPQYHPASVIYNRALADTLAEDIGRLGEMIRAEEKR